MSAQITQTKAAVSVTEMARMVGLSRARFYQLMDEGCFPRPTYYPETGRPYFDDEQQATCLEVRSRNVGINGKPVLFYARRGEDRSPTSRHRRSPQRRNSPRASESNAGLLGVVKALGLTSATTAQVEEAMVELYPQGTTGIGQGEMIRAVFLMLKARGSASGGRPVS